ncbi:MAG: hypothetical protein NVS3B26_20260 [Mycobacteriales bacterium]
MSRIVVSGWVAQFPTAPFLWHAISYVLGFRELGHEVWFLEDPGDAPWGWDNIANVADPGLHAGRSFLQRELASLGLEERWILRHVPENRWEGLSEDAARSVLSQAEVLVNVSMTTPMRAEYSQIPHRLAIDTDPVFTQIRIACGEPRLAAVPDWHTRLFTFGRSPLPGQAHEWVATRQPVATELWPVRPMPGIEAGLSSVLAWQSYPPVEFEGASYGAKDRTFADFRGLARAVTVPLRLALGGAGSTEAVRRQLAADGWRVEDGRSATASTAAYRNFLASSLGEFGLAKQGYVASRSGWFSERTCCYLASGRPAVVQDTGWSDYLPAGDGLLAFTTLDQAREAIESVIAEPARHAASARRLVERNFRAADVCSALLAAL